jgi:hypothetical protein
MVPRDTVKAQQETAQLWGQVRAVEKKRVNVNGLVKGHGAGITVR